MTALVVNGWKIYLHPLMQTQIDELSAKVVALRTKHPLAWKSKNDTKRLAAIMKLVFTEIPQDPTRATYRQGTTLGSKHTHWQRAKFFQQYRLFFRFHEQARIIVFAWVNDEDTKRAYNSKNDAYNVFAKMLADGHPPDNWEMLLAASLTSDSEATLGQFAVVLALQDPPP